MGGILVTTFIAGSDAGPTEEERIQYWKCHNKRIKSQEYYKKNKDEWYLDYIF